ncbi:hypothetical protein MMC17_004295 [Xylographa soralifera]|nr:hypothetical protein [Xylographa soralifera]
MEVAGIVIGAVALASLFTDCIECLDYIDVAQSFDRDYNILLTKLDIEKQRLLIWGESYGLLDDKTVDRTHHDSTRTEATVKRFLITIHMIFTDTDKMEEKYGLQYSGSSSPPGNSLHRAPFTRYASTIHKSKVGKSSSSNKFSWAIQDRSKFSAMITDLKDLIDGLENIVPEDNMKRQQLITKDIISLFPDVASLRLIQEACTDTHLGWSGIASHMIDISEAGSEDGRIFEWMDRFTAAESTDIDVMSVKATTEDHWNMPGGRSSVGNLRYEPPEGPRSRVPPASSLQRTEISSVQPRYPPANSTDPANFSFRSPKQVPLLASRKTEDSPRIVRNIRESKQYAEIRERLAAEIHPLISSSDLVESNTRGPISIRSGLFGSSRVKIGPPENPVHVIHVGVDPETDQFTVSSSESSQRMES